MNNYSQINESVDKPLVSVLIPAYNHERYVVQCLESIYNSDYQNIELIVIDDCSSDNTYTNALNWLKDNTKRFNKYHIHKHNDNIGVVKTLNELVGMSSGAYVVLIASDDLLLPNGITLRIEFLSNNPQYKAIFADAKYIDEDDNLICNEFQKNFMKANKEALCDSSLLPFELILRWSVPGPVFACKKELYDTEHGGVGLYDETLRGEDRDFYLRCLAKDLLGYIPDEVSCYRAVKTSMSNAHKNGINRMQYMCDTDKKNMILFKGVKRILLQIISYRIFWVIKYEQRHSIVALLFKKIFGFSRHCMLFLLDCFAYTKGLRK
jgi:glycosyltransferase involved in cell wall biosynthesis